MVREKRSSGSPIGSKGTAKGVVAELRSMGDPVKAEFFPRFFKTGKGEYGEGDHFFGVIVPKQRKVSKRFRDLPLREVERLLDHRVHECRLTAVLILVEKYQRGAKKKDAQACQSVVDLYLRRLDRVNNWDLVDSSAHKILGPHLEATAGGDHSLLDELADTPHLWSQRVAMMSTLHFIKRGEFSDTLRLAKKLLHHEHDLIHKIVGWMLRELGKQDVSVMEAFLLSHYKTMSRTALRYAIEKLPQPRRRAYIEGRV